MLGGDIFGVPVFGHWNHYHCGGGVFWLVVRAILESTPTLKRHEDYRWIGVGCTPPPLEWCFKGVAGLQWILRG